MRKYGLIDRAKAESQYNSVKGCKPRAYKRPLNSYLKTAEELCGRRKALTDSESKVSVHYARSVICKGEVVMEIMAPLIIFSIYPTSSNLNERALNGVKLDIGIQVKERINAGKREVSSRNGHATPL